MLKSPNLLKSHDPSQKVTVNKVLDFIFLERKFLFFWDLIFGNFFQRTFLLVLRIYL